MAPVKWAVTLGGQTFQLLLVPDGADGFWLEVAEEPGTASGRTAVSLRHVHHDRFQVRMGDRSAPVFVDRTAGGYKVVLYGHEFTAQVEDARLHRLKEVVASHHGPTGPARVNSPMPGLVVAVEVSEGDTVSAGTGLVVIESMKMENEIRAQGPGTVRRVLVEAGQIVDKGQPLLELAPPEA